jgi:hypothetical protein
MRAGTSIPALYETGSSQTVSETFLIEEGMDMDFTSSCALRVKRLTAARKIPCTHSKLLATETGQHLNVRIQAIPDDLMIDNLQSSTLASDSYLRL